ncbi:MAG: transketolase [Lachnospiraceae bacterium]|nr:transketolase [Lachnospiraceae bacterium]
MADAQEVKRLNDLAYEMRRMLINLCGEYEGSVHIGGDLSMTDLLIGLFHHGMYLNPDDIKDPARDRFILSKGHGAVCMYIAMSLRGFFDYDEIMKTYGQLDSKYGMHPCRVQLPALECSSGSLGQGLSMATGMAISAKAKKESHRIFCMLGDGETCEGSVWEAALTASSYKLGNLIAVIDRNKQMMCSRNGELINMTPYADKWKAFGWNVIEIDGHDMNAIVDVLDSLPPSSSCRPTAIVAHTIKGKGVDFMERVIGWHAGSLNKEDWARALKDLAKNYGREEA